MTPIPGPCCEVDGAKGRGCPGQLLVLFFTLGIVRDSEQRKPGGSDRGYKPGGIELGSGSPVAEDGPFHSHG